MNNIYLKLPKPNTNISSLIISALPVRPKKYARKKK